MALTKQTNRKSTVSDLKASILATGPHDCPRHQDHPLSSSTMSLYDIWSTDLKSSSTIRKQVTEASKMKPSNPTQSTSKAKTVRLLPNSRSVAEFHLTILLVQLSKVNQSQPKRSMLTHIGRVLTVLNLWRTQKTLRSKVRDFRSVFFTIFWNKDSNFWGTRPYSVTRLYHLKTAQNHESEITKKRTAGPFKVPLEVYLNKSRAGPSHASIWPL